MYKKFIFLVYFFFFFESLHLTKILIVIETQRFYVQIQSSSKFKIWLYIYILREVFNCSVSSKSPLSFVKLFDTIQTTGSLKIVRRIEQGSQEDNCN